MQPPQAFCLEDLTRRKSATWRIKSTAYPCSPLTLFLGDAEPPAGATLPVSLDTGKALPPPLPFPPSHRRPPSTSFLVLPATTPPPLPPLSPSPVSDAHIRPKDVRPLKSISFISIPNGTRWCVPPAHLPPCPETQERLGVQFRKVQFGIFR